MIHKLARSKTIWVVLNEYTYSIKASLFTANRSKQSEQKLNIFFWVATLRSSKESPTFRWNLSHPSTILFAACFFLICLTFRPWSWKWYVPLKCWIFFRTTRWYNLVECASYSHRCEYLKSFINIYVYLIMHQSHNAKEHCIRITKPAPF
jgi:hypothetical protein